MQNGLAHFLEHMAFNGTTRFPGGVMPYSEREKAFSPLTPARAVNQTVYNIEDVPTADRGIGRYLPVYRERLV